MDPTALPAGAALDALIAERIMGWRHIHDGFGRGPQTNPISLIHDPVPPFSTDIAAAWLVVETMIAEMERTIYELGGLKWDGPRYKPSDHYLTHEGYPLGTTCWYVMIERWGRGGRHFICADTAPLAIGRAALAALAE